MLQSELAKIKGLLQGDLPVTLILTKKAGYEEVLAGFLEDGKGIGLLCYLRKKTTLVSHADKA